MSPGPEAATMTAPAAQRGLLPYVPRLVVDWLREAPQDRVRVVDGTLAFVDISGFTRLTERLARRGNVGAEEMSDLLNVTFTSLLEVAYRDGAGLVKWGGDAVLLLFVGAGHAARAARAAFRMRARLREVGRLQTSAGQVTLRMSVGIHSGAFHFFLVGDPAVHRELLVCGPDATTTAEVEAVATAGEIAVSDRTAALLEPAVLGPQRDGARLLRREPAGPDNPIRTRASAVGLDIAATLPTAIRAHLRQSPGAAEHRQIAIAFVRFSSTDAVLEKRGPEALAQALDEVVRNVQEATERHGVTFFETDIDRDGGKIMLTAGAPRSGDHNEERLLRAARRVVDRAGTLPLQVGVNAGPVFTGDFGPPFRRTYSVKGDAVNLAARVTAKAAPGELLATDLAVARSQTTFRTAQVPPFLVKGKARPVQALRIGPVEGERQDPTGIVPLVGRTEELAVLRQALADAGSGAGRVVELVGEPGIGKSRLVTELLAEAGDFALLRAGGDEYETSTAYFTFSALLLDLLGLSTKSPTDQVTDALLTRVQQAAPELLAWSPLVATALGIELPPTPDTRALDPTFQKVKREEVTTQFLRAALPTPTLLVFDDVHLADDSSADLITQVASVAADRPWLVLLTRRDRTIGVRTERISGISTLRLAPLSAADSHALVSQTTADAPLAPHLLDALTERAGGSPLFLRGLVQAARSGAALDALPDTVEALITSQIDRLPPQERTVLRYASVLGVTFPERRLRSLLPAHLQESGGHALGRLSQFLRPDGEGRFHFLHALIRDTAYQGLPYQLRRALHGQVGEAIEADAADPAESSELLSFHFLHSIQPDKAWHYSRVAAERARAKYGYVEAATLYGRAIAAARSLPGVSDDELAQVLQSLGEAFMRVGDFPAAWSAFRDARLRVRTDPVRSADLWRRQAESEERRGLLSQCLRTAARGLRLLPDVDGAEALAVRSRLEGLAAVARENQGRYRDAITWARRAEADARRAEDKAALADALQALHASYSLLGAEQDRPYGRLALALYEELGDQAGQSRALNNLAVLAWIEGRGIESLQMLRRAEQVAVVAGDTHGAALTRYNIADGLLRQGRLADAEAALLELLPVLRGLGALDFAASAMRLLGLTLSLSGRPEEGRELLTTARATMVELGLAIEVVETDGAIAEALLCSGGAAGAAELAAAASEQADSLGAGYLLPTLQRIRGGALRDLGDLGAAHVVLSQALHSCESDGGVELGFVLAELVGLALATGDSARASELAGRSRTALAALGFVGSPRYRGPA